MLFRSGLVLKSICPPARAALLSPGLVNATVSTAKPLSSKHPDSTPTNRGAMSNATRCPALTEIRSSGASVEAASGSVSDGVSAVSEAVQEASKSPPTHRANVRLLKVEINLMALALTSNTQLNLAREMSGAYDLSVDDLIRIFCN